MFDSSGNERDCNRGRLKLKSEEVESSVFLSLDEVLDGRSEITMCYVLEFSAHFCSGKFTKGPIDLVPTLIIR